MNARQYVTLSLTALLTLVACYLVATRGGLIAWALLISAVLLLLKAWRRPAAADLIWSLTIAGTGALLWAVTFYYVITTWESGEVVELVISTSDGPHTARVWTMEIEGATFVYYDAPRAAADALLAGTPVQFTENGKVSTRIPDSTEADLLSAAQANQIMAAMTSKYGDRVAAADVFYLLLGRSTDRVAVLTKLIEQD